MFRKLTLAVLGLLLLALAVFGAIAASTARSRMVAEFERRMEADVELVRLLAPVTGPPETLQTSLQGLSRRLEVRFTVIGPDGKVLADSHGDPAGMDNHNSRPEIVRARAVGKGTSVRVSDTVHAEMMYHAVRLDSPPGHLVRAAIPLTRVEEEIGAILRALLIGFAGVALAGVLLAFLLAMRITRPLREVQAVAGSIAAGDFTRKAPRAPDEIGAVAGAMNRMAEELSLRLEGLRAERSKLEAVIAGMQEGVIAIDPSGRILHLNRAARSMFGVAEDPAGLVLWEAIRLPGFEEAARAALRGGGPASASFEVGDRVLSAHLGPVSGGQGAVVVARDVTEDRRYDTLRKEFVANVSHELRTPLSVIQGYVETLLDGAWKDEKSALEFLSTIDRNVKRLAAIVGDLLDLSRLESGGRPVEPRPLDVRGLLDRVADAYRPVASKRNQTVEVEAVRGVETIVADAGLLERAVSNLVDNALKYTPERGRVRVRAEPAGGGVAILVEDNGVGIPEADLPRIFERFYRVDKSRSRDLGGTGLGLAIVKHIAQLHGGTITVRSAPGQGSVFTLRIPQGSSK